MKSRFFTTLAAAIISVTLSASETFTDYEGIILQSEGQIVTQYSLDYFMTGDNSIVDFTVDSYNTKIFTIYNVGALEFDGTNWILTTSEDNSKLEDIGLITADNAGNIYYEIMDWGIIKENGEDVSFISMEWEMLEYFRENLFTDSEGTLWVGMNALGLYRYNSYQNNWQRNVTIRGDSFSMYDWYDNTIEAICEDSSHVIWAGTGNHIRSVGPDSVYTHAGDTELSNITAMATSPDGTVWACNRGNLFAFDGSNWETVPFPNVSYYRQYFTALTVDKDNNVWVMGEEIYKYDGKKWHYLKLDVNFHPRKMSFDKDGVLWIIGDNYIFSVNELTPLNSVFSNADVLENSKITVSPNPVTDQLHVSGIIGGEKYSIVNMSGDIVLNGGIKTEAIIQTDMLVPGTYFLKIDNSVSIFRKR